MRFQGAFPFPAVLQWAAWRSTKTVQQQVVRLCRARIREHYCHKLAACLETLQPADLSFKHPNGNSIESSINHLLAHLRLFTQPQLPGTAPAKIEDRFPDEGLIPRQLDTEVRAEFDAIDRFLATAELPGAAVDLGRLLHLLEHLSYHLGQVVLMTAALTGRRFGFVQGGINEAQLRTHPNA